jgi:hypothetical protein
MAMNQPRLRLAEDHRATRELLRGEHHVSDTSLRG